MRYAHLSCSLLSWELLGSKVFVRADLNAPLHEGEISSSFRLYAILPTLDLILKKKGKIILATHMGRPEGVDPKLSTQQLLPWFKQQGYRIGYMFDFTNGISESVWQEYDIILLENLRFYAGEKSSSRAFAEQLARLADFYVNDAFALLARSDTSIIELPTFFDAAHRSIGLLVAAELQALSKITHYPDHPFLLFLGGGKVVEKLPLLTALVYKADIIVLCPAIVFTFLAAQGKPIGRSLVDSDLYQTVLNLIEIAKRRGVKILFPEDYLYAAGSISGALHFCDADNFPADGYGITVGPKTIYAWQQYVKKAKTIFFNGAMGSADRPETMDSLHKTLRLIAESDVYSVVGGGDSVAALEACGLVSNIAYVSTGGSATLAVIADERLPGLDILLV